MQQAIVGFHVDEENDWVAELCHFGRVMVRGENDWVAELACGHNQHTRHNPPWINRPWVMSETGRKSMLGYLLNCKKCDEGAARDWF